MVVWIWDSKETLGWREESERERGRMKGVGVEGVSEKEMVREKLGREI